MAPASAIPRHHFSWKLVSIQSNTPVKFWTFPADLNCCKILGFRHEKKKIPLLCSHATYFCFLWQNSNWMITGIAKWLNFNLETDFYQTVLPFLCNNTNMSHIMRKPDYGICEQQRCRSTCASDQHLCFHFLDSIILLLAISEISRLQLASEAEQAGLSLTWSKIPKTCFLVTWLIYSQVFILVQCINYRFKVK